MRIKWHTEKRKVADLNKYEFNPRKMDDKTFEKLKASINDIGYAEIIAINTDNTIVAGHMRVRAMIALGMIDDEIEVRVPERALTEKEFQQYLIQSNKLTGVFDFDMLANVFDPTDLYDWGFTAKDLGMPDFAPADESEQGDLSKVGTDGEGKLKEVTCPDCGHTFEA